MDKRDENLNTSSSSDEEGVTSSISNDENKPGLYIIYSKWSLSRIDREVKLFGKIGSLRIICGGGKETNRTLALLESDVYDKLCDKGYADKRSNKGFNIAKFNEKALDLPPKGCTRNLFVRVPEVFRKDDMKTIDIIDDKLKHLVGWEVLPEDSWHVNALLESREKGAISSGCFIVFDSKIDTVTIAKVKTLITDTLWPLVDEDVEREYFKCLWAFDSKKKENKEEDKRYERKIKSDDKRSDRKIKSEDDTKQKSEDDKKPERRIKSETKSKKYTRKIKSEDGDEVIVVPVVLSIPMVSQPVEILDDIVNEVTVPVVLSTPTVSQPVDILDNIVTEENDS